MTMCQGRNVILTNKNVIAIYDKMKRAPDSTKGTSELQKEKRIAEYPGPNVIFGLFRVNKFFMIFRKRGCTRMSNT